MKLLMVVPAFPRLSETFIVNKFLGLLGRGHDVHVQCARSDEREWAAFPRLAAAGVRERVHVTWPTEARVRTAALWPAAALQAAWHNPRGWAAYTTRGVRALGRGLPRRLYLDARAIALAPDVVHFEFGGLARKELGIKDLLGARVVVSFRGGDITTSGLEDSAYYDDVWRSADALHLLGEDLWRRARERGCPEDLPHALIPPAIDVERFLAVKRMVASTVGTPARPLRLLSVGRLDWKKGHEYVLAALRRLVDRGVHAQLRIVGGGEQRVPVELARRDFRLELQAELLGPRAPNEVLEQLAWADVFVHGAVSEGFCNAVIEAQAAGLPVVTSDAGGLAENIAHGETGFVVPRREPDAMVARLVELAADPALRTRMGAAGRARASTRYQLGPQIDAFERLYRGVLERPRR